MKKIIENLKGKIQEQDVEQKIYEYLDYLDQNGGADMADLPIKSLEYVKTKRTKRDPRDSNREMISKQATIDQKMIELKKNFEKFATKVKSQQEENQRLKQFLGEIMKEQNGKEAVLERVEFSSHNNI